MPETVYTPFLSEKEISKRRIWQEKVYQNLKNQKETYKLEILGKEIFVCPEVFAPLWEDSIILAKAVKKETKKGDSVLDMGTGTGIQALFAAEKASKVLATDINPAAIKCAKLNVKNQKLENKISVIESDLFSNIYEKFDLIVFNPPFRWFKPRDMLERGNLDEDYKTLTKFSKEAKDYLKENGRMLTVFSTSGDIKYFENLIRINKYESEVLDKQKRNNWEYKVYKMTLQEY